MEEVDPESSPEETLLLCARQGQTNIIRDLIRNKQQGKLRLDINCKGKRKKNRCWTPLQLAAYFGNVETVKLLLEAGANINVVNNVGDTALHKAALTGRLDIVTLLLTNGADVSIRNAEGDTPKSIAKIKDIIQLLQAAEKHEHNMLEEEFMSSVRDGDVKNVEDMITQGKLSNFNVCDDYGNTALHLAAQAEQRQMTVYLLQHGIDSQAKNKQGLMAVDMARSQQMKQLLHVKPKTDAVTVPTRYEGVLWKRSAIFGKTATWVVVERGVLSYFKNRGDASTGAKRRGMKYLDTAVLKIAPENNYDFCIEFSDGALHRLATNSADSADVTRQRWLNTLRDHIAYNTHYINKGGPKEETAGQSVSIATIQDAVKNAQAHQDVLENKLSELQDFLTRQTDVNNSSSKTDSLRDLYKEVEKVVGYSRDTATSFNMCLNLFTHKEHVWKKQFDDEIEKGRVLQEALHALALEHHELEKSYSRSSIARSYVTDDDEFYDCEEDDLEALTYFRRRRSLSAVSSNTDALSFKSFVFDPNMEEETKNGSKPDCDMHFNIDLKGRNRLPVPMFDRNDFSFWSILKQCIGKELSKITMPVVFNEPLTFLQRISEYLEYGSLLETASQQEDPVQRMMYVAAFAVSAISSNWERIGKPFNPLLGETFELDRPDLGFRLVSEQVSHHPPVSAFHVESKSFKFHGSIHPKLKFWGKSVEISPKGILTLELLRHGEVYTWQNVNCCVHNVIVGKLWVEHVGVMEVLNHKTKHRAVLNFKQGGWFGKDLHKVEGHIFDAEKRKQKVMYGSWVYDLFAADEQKYEDYMKSKPDLSPKHTTTTGNGEAVKSDTDDNIPTHHFSTFNLNVPDQVILWRAAPRPPNSDKYFSFTQFAMALNEMTEDIVGKLAPTDSRTRPDVRLLEEGNIDGAAEEKNRLEEKQRTARKERKRRKEEWTATWFNFGINPTTQKEDWLFREDYWQKPWEKCPNIF